MDFFDLHCDTLTQLMQSGGSLWDAPGCHVSLKKASAFGRWAQVYACFVPDAQNGKGAFTCYERQRDVFLCQMKQCAQQVRPCADGAALSAAFACGQRAAILSVENGAALEGDISRLEIFRRDGVRFLTLTWFGENELGYGSLAGGRLKPFGREVVKKLPEYGIVPDISHLSDEGTAELFALTDGPLVATHSNARSQNGHCRNLTDAQIREVTARGGLIGLNLCSAFLSENATSAGAEDIRRHMEAFFELGAQNVLCFGTDFDGAQVPRDIRDISGMPALYEAILKYYSKTLLDGVFFENAARFFRRMWP